MGIDLSAGPSLQVSIRKKLKGFKLGMEFHAGRGCLGILGPSGCGKSMTLKSIAGIVTPDAGRIALLAFLVGCMTMGIQFSALRPPAPSNVPKG